MGFFKDCGCGCGGSKAKEKFMTALIMSLIFYVVSNPVTYRIVRRILGSFIATPNGCPTQVGILVHTAVFMAIVWGILNVKKEKYTVDVPSELGKEGGRVKLPEKVKRSPALKVINVPFSEFSRSTGPKVKAMSQNRVKPPVPGEMEPRFESVGGGMNLGSMDLNTEADTPF